VKHLKTKTLLAKVFVAPIIVLQTGASERLLANSSITLFVIPSGNHPNNLSLWPRISFLHYDSRFENDQISAHKCSQSLYSEDKSVEFFLSLEIWSLLLFSGTNFTEKRSCYCDFYLVLECLGKNKEKDEKSFERKGHRFNMQGSVVFTASASRKPWKRPFKRASAYYQQFHGRDAARQTADTRLMVVGRWAMAMVYGHRPWARHTQNEG